MRIGGIAKGAKYPATTQFFAFKIGRRVHRSMAVKQVSKLPFANVRQTESKHKLNQNHEEYLKRLLLPFCCFWAQDQAIDRIFFLMVPPVAITMVVAAFSACPRQAFVRRRPGTIAA
jgi:hypothetical protein